MVKARYTPQQTMVLGVDEQESPHHHTLCDAQSVEGMPCVVADLHSALPAIVAAARHRSPNSPSPTFTPTRRHSHWPSHGRLPASSTVGTLKPSRQASPSAVSTRP
nr:DUF3866 family protein [Flaviflexus ciconiae]